LSTTKKYLTEPERQELLDDVNRATGESIPSFDALRKRVERIRDRGTLSRKPGSGRKRKVTEEHVEAANSVARAFGGNISRQKIFETVREQMGPEKAVGRTQLYEMMGTRLKARRTRYKPSLTSSQKQLRVAYAQQQVSSAFEEEERTVFADEKRFEAHSPGILNIPVEDLTPKHFAQSKGNSPFVMVLVVVVAPRGDWNGVVAAVPFMERVDAARASKNREAGTIEYKSLNVTKENYVSTWREKVLPQLQKAIQSGKMAAPTSQRPLFFQDDNAKPHRGAFKDGLSVQEFICKCACDMGIEMQPKKPAQPPQSPDLNPLDTFLFRVLALEWRRYRAQMRVQELAGRNALSRARGEDRDGRDGLIPVELNFDDAEDEGDGRQPQRRTVPLRCKPEATRARALCGGCRQAVSDNDERAVQCDVRNGWWHLQCVDEVVGTDLYVRGVLPDLDSDEPWVCPQCSMHLCRNDDRTNNLCLLCWKPSARNGDSMGTDMIVCEGPGGGLFHKSCAGYDEEEMENLDDWYCLACEKVRDQEFDKVEDLEERPVGGHDPRALYQAVTYALGTISTDVFRRGFESRREIIKKVLEVDGANTYNLHWRGRRKAGENE
jgi:hypothetical protein